MIDLCQTRWTQRDVAYQHFLDLYQFTIKTENIAYSMPRDEYGERFQDCKTDCKRKNGAFINHVIMELDEAFSNLASFTVNILGLVPSVLCSGTFNVNVEQLKNKHAKDLPSGACLEQQIYRWKSGFSSFQSEELRHI